MIFCLQINVQLLKNNLKLRLRKIHYDKDSEHLGIKFFNWKESQTLQKLVIIDFILSLYELSVLNISGLIFLKSIKSIVPSKTAESGKREFVR